MNVNCSAYGIGAMDEECELKELIRNEVDYAVQGIFYLPFLH